MEILDLVEILFCAVIPVLLTGVFIGISITHFNHAKSYRDGYNAGYTAGRNDREEK